MSLEPINLNTHGADIRSIYETVVKGTDDATQWVIYSPDASKAYFPSSTGANFSDFLSEFDDAKVEYGLCRCSPPGSDVYKLILVGWCPDSAALKSKASFAQNFAEVASLLKGYHVQVTARDSDDLDEKELLQRLSNASGARYSIQATSGSKPAVKSAPSASVVRNTTPKVTEPIVPKPAPKPVKPIPSPEPVEADMAPEPIRPKVVEPIRPKVVEPIRPKVIEPIRPKVVEPIKPKPTATADEWDEPELEERDFTKKPLTTSTPAWKPIGKVDLQKVIADETAKEDPRLVTKASDAAKINPSDEISKLKAAAKAKRDEEMAQLRSSAHHEQSEPKVEAKIEPKVEPKVEAKIEPKVEPKVEAKVEPKVEPRQAPTAPPARNAIGRAMAESEEDEDEDEDWDDDAPALPKRETAPILPKREVTPILPKREVTPVEAEEKPVEDEEEEEEEVPALPKRSVAPVEEEAPALPKREESVTRATPPPPPPARTKAELKTVTVTAEYDYEAGEDNELSFTEGTKIINVQFVDEDWWLGELESGEKGLFPSNYVVLDQ